MGPLHPPEEAEECMHASPFLLLYKLRNWIEMKQQCRNQKEAKFDSEKGDVASSTYFPAYHFLNHNIKLGLWLWIADEMSLVLDNSLGIRYLVVFFYFDLLSFLNLGNINFIIRSLAGSFLVIKHFVYINIYHCVSRGTFYCQVVCYCLLPECRYPFPKTWIKKSLTSLHSFSPLIIIIDGICVVQLWMHVYVFFLHFQIWNCKPPKRTSFSRIYCQFSWSRPFLLRICHASFIGKFRNI